MEELNTLKVNSAEENDIELKTGETFRVKGTDGKVLGVFSFDPSDLDLPRRINELVKWFNTIQIPEGDGLEGLYKLSDEFKERLNQALNSSDAADVLFSSNPFSPMEDGTFFGETVLQAVAGVIEKKTGSRIKKVNKRLQEYTKKYHK